MIFFGFSSFLNVCYIKFMCGIAGIVGFKDKNSCRQKINLMAESLEHRGPDATGIYVDENVAFAHLRLSIIDLSDSANQPFFDSSNRYLIIFNGEIYNFREIKSLLPEYNFKTDSDTEVLLAAYLKFGKDCLSLLNGMFAFAVWDKQTRELFVARDRLGVKPFYYAQNDGGVFVFASEIRAILNSAVIPRKLSYNGVYDYLMYQSVYAPNTIVENVFQLQAGEYGIFADGKFATHSYWRIEETSGDPSIENESEIRRNVKNLLLESVERRMISDVRLGAFLSGGIDSSAIVALMSEVSSRPVDTFSVNFDEKKYDESVYSQMIAEKFKTNHTSVRLTANDFLEELPNALKATDSPSGDGINTYVVSKATKQAGITVALSGLGGDELFAGYPNFLNWMRIRQGFLNKVPFTFLKVAGKAFGKSKNSKNQRTANILKLANHNISSVYPMFRQVMSQQTVAAFTKTSNISLRFNEFLSEKQPEIEKFPLLSQFSIAEILGYTQNVLLKDTDQFSMASALEVREPFFDYKLVEYVLQIPDKFKYPKYPKSLLVESIYPLLPKEIVHRPKMGFVLPFDQWMKNDLKEFCQNRIENLADRSLFDNDILFRKWNDFLSGKNGVLWSHLWHLIVLTEWLENNKF